MRILRLIIACALVVPLVMFVTLLNMPFYLLMVLCDEQDALDPIIERAGVAIGEKVVRFSEWEYR